jgi:hypothetical protein
MVGFRDLVVPFVPRGHYRHLDKPGTARAGHRNRKQPMCADANSERDCQSLARRPKLRRDRLTGMRSRLLD